MFMVSDFTACQAVATDQQPYRRSKRRRKRRHRHYSDDEVEIDEQQPSSKRRKPAIVCPQSDFQALLQQHDELDRVFSESCLTVLNLSDLLGDERNGYRARPHETVETVALVKEDDENNESGSPENSGCSDQETITARSMLRCFTALWYQVSGGEATDCFLRPPNRLYSNRRDVLAVALAFRFSVRGSPFAVHTRSLLATYRERLDLIVECVHMAECKRSSHDCCDITYSADTVTVSLSNDIVEKAVRVVRDMDAATTSQQPAATLELMQTISKQLWLHITEFWLARLALSTYVHDYAKRLNSRLTRLTKQLFRIAGLPPVFLTTSVIQLYVTMFVRTFEVCRQVETNTWRLLYARPAEQRQLASEGDDRLEDRLDNNNNNDNDDDDEFADEMDQQLQSVEEDRVQCRVRRFVTGYVYYLTGGRSGVPTNRLAAARVANVNLDVQNDCRELIALNETVMDVFLTLRALYFEPQTARHDRFVASLNRIYRVEHNLNVELRDRKSMLALPTIQNPIDLFELDFLVRKIREIVDRYRCDESVVGSPAPDCDDANALMSIIESDVNRLNDQNFRLKERGWDQCDGWIFTRDDFWKYTYVYALLSNVTDTECLREIRQLISMFDQLLRVKFYRLLFVPVGSAATQPQPMEGVEFDDPQEVPVLPNLADIYDNVETNMRTQRDYLNGVYGTLDSINRLTSAR